MGTGAQTQTAFASTSDTALREWFCHSNWKTLNETERRELLQEVVNREVEKNGGQYRCNVVFEDLPSNTAGEQRGNTICLNRQMFAEDKLTETYNGRTITYSLPDSNYKAFETVLHEHQHVKQDLIAAGEIPSDEKTKAAFQANAFTTTDISGKAGSQYMLGEMDYSLYYLNPTELDAFRTSQTAAKQLVSEHNAKYGADTASAAYLNDLSKTGYEARLAQYREMYKNDRIDKDVEDVLVSKYFNDHRPLNPEVEKLVTMEMVKSQELIDAYHSKELSNMGKQTFTKNGFTFVVDNETGTTTAKGQVTENHASRNGMQSIHPNEYDSKIDDKGHLIAAREGGPAEGYNVSAQNRTLNRGAYKTVENAEVRLANEGNEVETEKTAYVSNPGSKPDAYMVNDTITTPEGETQHVNLSFQNASPEEQQEWNDYLEQNVDIDEQEYWSSAKENMSPDEHNAMAEDFDNELSSVKDEYDLDNTTESSFAETAPENEGVSADVSGVDGGADFDGGADCNSGMDNEID